MSSTFLLWTALCFCGVQAGIFGTSKVANKPALVHPPPFPKQNLTLPIPAWKQQLPSPLNNRTRTLQRLMFSGPQGTRIELYLLGTAHVSKDSSKDVQLLLESVNPDVLFLELCDQRTALLLAPDPPSKTNSTNATMGNAGGSSTSNTDASPRKLPWWKRMGKSEEKGMLTMASSFLTSMQEDVADSLDVELGGEFRVAFKFWNQTRAHQPLHLILGDRPLHLTLTRAWESLGVWGKCKLMVGLLVSSFQKPNPEELREWMQSIFDDETGDLLSKSMAELGEQFPTLEEVIIRERDAYMACKLFQTCRQLLGQPRPEMQQQQSATTDTRSIRIVAVVGAGHIDGICRWLTIGNGQSPEDVLKQLIITKKEIFPYLVRDVMEVNYDNLISNMEQ